MPAETVKVVVRVRPFNQREKDLNSKPCVVADEKTNSVELTKASENDVKTFTYDYVFGQDTPQQQIYEKTAFPLIESVVEGYNGTIFAYGQTGCGKTFTMIGNPQSEQMKGIIPRAFDQIINIINNNSDSNRKYLLRCSYIEIYNEEIHDLLGQDVKARLELKEQNNNVVIKDLQLKQVRTTQDMEKYMAIGTNSRSVAATAMNAESSRSHCIFTVLVECISNDAKGNERITAGKLNLVDLAGSERQSKTQATGDRLKEATKINLSLSALGNVISALVDGKTNHIPYRDSKLTRLLQDSLGGNTKTIMITAVSPSDNNYDETLSSLRYASRAKMIKNQPKVNEDPKDALLKEQAEEIKKLRELLLKQTNGQGNPQELLSLVASNGAQQGQQGNNNNQLLHGKTQELDQLKDAHNKLLKERQQVEEGLNKIKEIENVKEENAKLLQEKERIEREKMAVADAERLAREQLEQLIKEKEQMLMQGGKGNEEEKKKYKNYQKKIQNQKKEHEQLLQEREKQNEELMQIEKNYENVQQEVESLKKKLKFISKKYQDQINENKDLLREKEYQREDLTETIQLQDKELKLIGSIVKMMFTEDELASIKAACEWDEEKEDYICPPFIIKNKKAAFPKLSVQQATDFIEQEKQNRYIDFNNKESRQSDVGDLQIDNRSYHRNPSPYKPDHQSNSLTLLDRGLQVVEKYKVSNQSMQQQQYTQVYSPAQAQQALQPQERKTKVQLQPIENNNQRVLSVQNPIQQNLSSPPTANRKNVQLQPIDKPQLPLYPQGTPDGKRKR